MKNRFFFIVLMFFCGCLTFGQSTLLPPKENPFGSAQETPAEGPEPNPEPEKKETFDSNFSISEFLISTEGKWNQEDAVFGFSSDVSMELTLKTGNSAYAFSGFDIEADNIERLFTDKTSGLSSNLALKLSGAGFGINNIKESGFYFQFFTGKNDRLASGGIFSSLFQEEGIRPFFYKTTEKNDLYRGIHRVIGTGFNIGVKDKSDKVSTNIYLYQDNVNPANKGIYAIDYAFNLNLPVFKMSSFVGFSTPAKEQKPLFRSGVMCFLTNGKDSGLYTELGIPYYPIGDKFTIENLYILFEPRFRVGLVTTSLTFFYNPEYYLEEKTDEGGDIDLSLRLAFGDIEKKELQGGLESTLNFITKTDADIFDVLISPFLSLKTGPVFWDGKLNISVLNFKNPREMFSFNLITKAEF